MKTASQKRCGQLELVDSPPLIAVVVAVDLISGYVGTGESPEHVCREWVID